MPRYTIRDKDGNVKEYLDTDEPYDTYNPPQETQYSDTVDHPQAALHIVIFALIIAFFSGAYNNRIGCGVAIGLVVFGILYFVWIVINDK
jgi:hypothetical protein